MSGNPVDTHGQTSPVIQAATGLVGPRDSRLRLFFAWPSDRNDGSALSAWWILAPPISVGIGVIVIFLILHYRFQYFFTPEFIQVIVVTVVLYSAWAISRGSMGVRWVYPVLAKKADETTHRRILHIWVYEWAGFLFGPISLAGAGYIFFFGPRNGVTLALASLLPAGTIVFLALFTRYSTRAFSDDATRQLDRTAEHWREQTQHLVDATAALKQVVELQSGALDLTRAGIRLDEELLHLETERERVRIQGEEVQRRRLQPQIGLSLEIPDALIKHMNVYVHNRGMDGRNLVLFFGVTPSQVLQHLSQGITPQEVVHVDFGDIASWPADANLAITCEISDVLGNRYRFVTFREYHRSLSGGFVQISAPTVSPAGWTYPDSARLT